MDRRDYIRHKILQQSQLGILLKRIQKDDLIIYAELSHLGRKP
jgi:hypothetical protein